MTDGPGFDPYEVLGVDIDADAIVIQLAYKARIRQVHPDIAGASGSDRAKRLNVARDWLLDPNLRAQLARSTVGQAQPGEATAGGRRRRGRNVWAHRRPRAGPRFERSRLDPFTFDLGPHSDRLRAFFRAISVLSKDERARVNYSLGDARPVFFDGYRDYLAPTLWSRSRALRDAVSLLWEQGVDEEAPFVFPIGRMVPTGSLVVNAYAQWILLSDFFREELGDAVFRSEQFIDSFAMRCTGPWDASIGQARYGPYQARVNGFFRTAGAFSVEAAERLARSWHRHMGRDGLGNPSEHIGPGVWLPAPSTYPEVLKVSGYLAAVDASRIEPPPGLEERLHDGFRYGLRLTAHVVALGLIDGAARDYLRPWRDAVGPDRSLWRRLRSRMPTG